MREKWVFNTGQLCNINNITTHLWLGSHRIKLCTRVLVQLGVLRIPHLVLHLTDADGVGVGWSRLPSTQHHNCGSFVDVTVSPPLGYPSSKSPLYVIGPIVHIEWLSVDKWVNGAM